MSRRLTPAQAEARAALVLRVRGLFDEKLSYEQIGWIVGLSRRAVGAIAWRNHFPKLRARQLPAPCPRPPQVPAAAYFHHERCAS